MSALEILLHALALLLSAASALAVDRLAARRGLAPPGFATSWRRAAAAALLALVLWLTVFGALPELAGGREPVDLDQLTAPMLFLVHVLLLATLLVWYGLAYGLTPPAGGWRNLARQLGLVAPRPLQEVAVGVFGGLAGWLGMVVVLVTVVGVYSAVKGPESLPSQAPELVVWMVGLPVTVRLGLALSAGVVEEAFFRGLLQPRVGVGLSTALFVLAHAGYQQPLQLVGLTFLSLLLAALVVWRQTIWPAVIAHAVFDAVQLLWVIPFARQFAPTGPAALLAVPVPLPWPIW